MDVLNKLKQTPISLSELTEKLDEAALTKKLNNKWSIIVHAGHLLTMESLWIARLDDFFLERPVLRPWNGHNKDTEDGMFEKQSILQILSDFSSLRNAHLAMIEKNYNRLKDRQCFLEVQSTSISFDEHLKIVLDHDLKHLEIIKSRLA